MGALARAGCIDICHYKPLSPHEGWRSSEVLLCSQVCPAVQLVGCDCAACGLPQGSAPSVLGTVLRQHLDMAGEGRSLFPLSFAERNILMND